MRLQLYEPQGFEAAIAFTALFGDLRDEWMNGKLCLMAKGTLSLEKGSVKCRAFLNCPEAAKNGDAITGSVPLICYKNMAQKTVVERLRMAE